MSPATIIGDRAAGRTTFYGLVYSTMIARPGSEAASFRFYAPPESSNVLTQIFATLTTGSFPNANVKDDASRMRFLVASRDQGLRQRLGAGPVWRSIEFAPCFASAEDVWNCIEGGASPGPAVTRLIESRLWVVLVDCSRMPTDPQSSSFRRIGSYDAELARLIEGVPRLRDRIGAPSITGRRPRSIPRTFPLLFLTKADRIPASVLDDLRLPRSMADRDKGRDHREFCETLIRELYPRTLAAFRTASDKEGKSRFGEVEYFVSSVRTIDEAGPDGTMRAPRIATRVATPSEPRRIEYSRDEYVRFLSHVRKLLPEVADRVAEDWSAICQSPGDAAARRPS